MGQKQRKNHAKEWGRLWGDGTVMVDRGQGAQVSEGHGTMYRDGAGGEVVYRNELGEGQNDDSRKGSSVAIK